MGLKLYETNNPEVVERLRSPKARELRGVIEMQVGVLRSYREDIKRAYDRGDITETEAGELYIFLHDELKKVVFY